MCNFNITHILCDIDHKNMEMEMGKLQYVDRSIAHVTIVYHIFHATVIATSILEMYIGIL
jgi:hypothetical protein